MSDLQSQNVLEVHKRARDPITMRIAPATEGAYEVEFLFVCGDRACIRNDFQQQSLDNDFALKALGLRYRNDYDTVG